MKKILLISLAAAGLVSGVAQAAPAARLPALSSALAPTALSSFPALPAASSSRPLVALYPLVNNQVLANPLLGTPLSGFFGKVNNVIVGAVKIGPPVPPKNDPASN